VWCLLQLAASPVPPVPTPRATPSISVALPANLDTTLEAFTGKITLPWTDAMYFELISTMLDQCRLGKRADSGFKRRPGQPSFQLSKQSILVSLLLKRNRSNPS
jgi:hypothetical protein